ncbi:hypothetical protein LJR034_003281 [Caballeronia sp. LjRoot34]|uniref:hypothetical protein n=1 Tax=Caballeronia sp. LjRoot34 TaxID=3342325 RepID=UPI003ECE090D
MTDDFLILNDGFWRAPCKGGAFPVDESPTRQPLQPEATGAIVEVTKRLKPSVKRVTKYGDSASVQAVTRVNAEQASKTSMRGPT